MSPAMAAEMENTIVSETQVYQKGVKNLADKGLNKLPLKYVLPNSDRPADCISNNPNVIDAVELPVIDFNQLCGPNRRHVLRSLSKSCEDYGFFQVVFWVTINLISRYFRTRISTKCWIWPTIKICRNNGKTWKERSFRTNKPWAFSFSILFVVQ